MQDFDNFDWENEEVPTKKEEKIVKKDQFGSNKKRSFKPPECVKTIYCDGGSKIVKKDNQTWYIGAFAYYMVEDQVSFSELSLGSTNNQMELKAVIEAIKYLNSIGIPKDRWCTIMLDSEYVRLGIVFWSKKWAKNGWKRISKTGEEEEIKNLDLWKELYQLNTERKIFYEHVAAHSGNEYNERVDEACSSLIKKYIDSNLKD